MVGGTFHSDTDGTFQSDTSGTFHSVEGGTFVSDTSGTFIPILSCKATTKTYRHWQRADSKTQVTAVTGTR